jgi:hypothetical protein
MRGLAPVAHGGGRPYFQEVVMGRGVVRIVVAGVVIIGVGWLALKLLGALFGVFSYLLVGALVVGGGIYVYGRVKRSLAPGTRNAYRLEAAAKTYRMRNR